VWPWSFRFASFQRRKSDDERCSSDSFFSSSAPARSTSVSLSSDDKNPT
jgi:hypothetical protein